LDFIAKKHYFGNQSNLKIKKIDKLGNQKIATFGKLIIFELRKFILEILIYTKVAGNYLFTKMGIINIMKL